MKLLFAASEAYPLIKTGGLADVAHSLPNALQSVGSDVRVILPAYRDLLRKVSCIKILGWLSPLPHHEVRILEVEHPAFDMPIWLVDDAGFFDREGNPYIHPAGDSWLDNPDRFAMFSRCVALMAMDRLDLGWRADVVHSNDWQTGLVSGFLSEENNPPLRIFTIHNIAYDSQFDYASFSQLHLPAYWWSVDYGEFYERFSMLKAGLMFADKVTTVSPTYAKEICTSEYGYGYAGILQQHTDKLSGILNGIDDEAWNPEKDTYLAAHYSADKSLRKGKHKNRAALLKALGVKDDPDAPLFGFVGRLAYQKGADILLSAIPALIEKSNARFVLIGSGEAELESRIRTLAEQFPHKVAYYIGYSEEMAHRLEAGCDFFVMPSRYEPCGLNQMYSMRYGTPPIVRNTGGLADTVIDYNEANLKTGTATGFVFEHARSDELLHAMERALQAFEKPKVWDKLARNGMQRDMSWQASAKDYLSLYGFEEPSSDV